MRNLWGEGLETRWYWRGRLGLRRNALVYEVSLYAGRVRLVVAYRRLR